jgi:hypothetical protein
MSVVTAVVSLWSGPHAASPSCRSPCPAAAQIEDWQWSLPVTGNTGVTNTTNITDFATCVANCIAPDCQFVTYHYSTQTCFTRLAIAPVLAG